MSERCYICGENNPNVLQTHHVLPRRYDGKDSRDNLVQLCANCHQAVESIYDEAFFDRVFARATEYSQADGSVKRGIEAYINEEAEMREGGLKVPPKGTQGREKLYQDYVDFCETRRLPVHTSKTRFFTDLEELAPNGTVVVR